MAYEALNRMNDFFTITPLSMIRTLKDHGEDIREMIEHLRSTDGHRQDWTGERYRVIHEDDALEILEEELKNDEYVLGCFNASFIAGITGVPVELVQAAQDGEKFDVIGKWLIDADHVGDMAEQYAHADGFGHHFAHYDGDTDEQAGGWLVFKIN